MNTNLVFSGDGSASFLAEGDVKGIHTLRLSVPCTSLHQADGLGDSGLSVMGKEGFAVSSVEDTVLCTNIITKVFYLRIFITFLLLEVV